MIAMKISNVNRDFFYKKEVGVPLALSVWGAMKIKQFSNENVLCFVKQNVSRGMFN